MDSNELNAASGDKLVNDLKVLMADVEEYLRASAGQAGEAYAAARAGLEATLSTVKTQLDQATREVAGTTKEAAQAANSFVHQNPWQAMALGAGACMLLGLLVGRR